MAQAGSDTTANCGQIVHDLAVSRFEATFRAYVGRGRAHSIEALAEASGIPARNLRSYQSGEATPGLAYFLTLIAHLGPTFAAAVMEPAGVSTVLMDDAGERPCPRALNTAVSTFAAALAAANETGINHATEPDLKAAARALMPMLAAFVREQ